MEMRKEVLEELSRRIAKLENNARPGDIATGMSGSLIRFNMAIDSLTAMTEEEFRSDTYDEWIKAEHKRVYNKVNSKLNKLKWQKKGYRPSSICITRLK